jgi:hypothetical protein
MRRRLPAIALFAAMAGALNLGLPAPAAASNDVTTTATQTYEFRPAQHLVHVTIDLTVKNTLLSKTTYEPCIKYQWDYWYGLMPYSSTCPHTTNYYVSDAALWVEDAARNLKITADTGSVSRTATSRSYGFTNYALTFKRLFSGRSRTIHASYDLRSSAPRTSGGIRAGEAYASFCVSGNGPDGGQIRVITPNGFDFSHSDSAGLTFAASHSNGRTVYASGRIASPISAASCFEGTNLEGYSRVAVRAPGGRSVIVASWPEDKLWASAVANDVLSSLPALQQLVGRPLPGSGPIEIREVTGLGDYAGFYNADSNVAAVSEHFSQPGLVAHELSHAWFNNVNLASTWISEGYAGWVASQNGAASCDRAPTYPGAGKPDLQNWTYVGPKATAAQRSVVDYQYDAACWVVASVASRIGEARMTAVIAAVFDGYSAYGSASAKNSSPATWQSWLDAVDELGMVPAGESDLDLVQQQLVRVGAAPAGGTLTHRSESRAAYHALIAAADGWSIPDAISRPLTTWDFGRADDAITTAQRARTEAERADALLPEIGVMSGPIARQWQAARTQADLEAVAALARDEAEAAKAVVTSRTLVADADPITNIGLIGSDTTPLFEQAIAALRDGTPAVALTSASDVTDMVKGATGSGWLRISIATSGGVGLVLLALFVIRRRRQHAIAPAGVPVSAVTSEGPPADTPAELDAIGLAPAATATALTLEQARESMNRLAMLVTDADSARAVLRLSATPAPIDTDDKGAAAVATEQLTNPEPA